MTYRSLDEAIGYIRSHEKPLALYLFTESRETANRIIKTVSFGGGCINDTIMHITSSKLPFGGVGQSGMGSYHGKYSYRTFSRDKSIVSKTTLIDIPVRYRPFNRLKRALIRLFLR